MEKTLEYVVQEEDGGGRLDRVVIRRLGISTALLRRLKRRQDGILKNSFPARTCDAVAAGDVLSLKVEEEESFSPGVPPVPGEVALVYEDSDLLIVNKRAGVPVHPSQGHRQDSLGNHLAWYFEQKGESFTFRPVNRLDRGTSGLMAVAKNAYAAQNLSGQLLRGELSRRYLALAEGELTP